MRLRAAKACFINAHEQLASGHCVIVYSEVELEDVLHLLAASAGVREIDVFPLEPRVAHSSGRIGQRCRLLRLKNLVRFPPVARGRPRVQLSEAMGGCAVSVPPILLQLDPTIRQLCLALLKRRLRLIVVDFVQVGCLGLSSNFRFFAKGKKRHLVLLRRIRAREGSLGRRLLHVSGLSYSQFVF